MAGRLFVLPLPLRIFSTFWCRFAHCSIVIEKLRPLSILPFSPLAAFPFPLRPAWLAVIHFRQGHLVPPSVICRSAWPIDQRSTPTSISHVFFGSPAPDARGRGRRAASEKASSHSWEIERRRSFYRRISKPDLWFWRSQDVCYGTTDWTARKSSTIPTSDRAVQRGTITNGSSEHRYRAHRGDGRAHHRNGPGIGCLWTAARSESDEKTFDVELVLRLGNVCRLRKSEPRNAQFVIVIEFGFVVFFRFRRRRGQRWFLAQRTIDTPITEAGQCQNPDIGV